MYKAKFAWIQGFPEDGKSVKKEKIIIFGVCTADELNLKIENYIEENSGCYVSSMRLIDITCI